MATRTYVPQIVNLLRLVCKYIVAHRVKLVANVGTGGGAALDDIVTACEVFIALVPEDIPTE